MTLLYALSFRENPLYGGKYRLRGRYQTYGQQAFVYDVVVAASRRGVKVTLMVEGLHAFPLAEPLRRHCTVVDADDRRDVGSVDLTLVDEPSETLLRAIPSRVRTLCCVHKKGATYSEAVRERCNGFVCMTEGTVEYQAKYIARDKLIFARHGVDLQRFVMNADRPHAQDRRPHVLFYSRLDREESVMWQVLEELLRANVRLTMLGDGDAFWAISDRFGDRLTLINHIPCHSIHHFLHHFDIVVSAGRGVMEALASGLPALAAGFAYGGPVLPENIKQHLEVNLTGFSMARPLAFLTDDLHRISALAPQTCRRMAEEYCSVDGFLDNLAIA
jgi:glycosyltransferase involved in cell wall biosynthesis